VPAVLADVGAQGRAEGSAEAIGHPAVELHEVGAQVAGARGRARRGKGVREGGDDELEFGGPPPVDRRLACSRPGRDALHAEVIEAVLGEFVEGRPVDGLFQRLAAAARAPPEVIVPGVRTGRVPRVAARRLTAQ
jgi:hypothetical protein